MPVIALLTDFGTRDYYVAAMKGVILGIAPDVTLVDVTHDIAPQDVAGAAFELAACYTDFPAGTVFLVVVDPGVGTGRRAIAVKSGEYSFVGPDNGVLEAAFAHCGDTVAVELANPRFARAVVSRTFEGRDRFAPAAAWLARGIEIREFGPRIQDVARLVGARPERRGDVAVGRITKVDRFGNLVSNIEGADLERPEARSGVVRIAGTDIRRMVATYGEVAPGELCALVGSSGYLEVSVNGGSAAERLDAGRGARVELRFALRDR